MEINLKKLGEQAIESTTGSKKMRLSENASSMVFQLFTKNVYSNPIGTVVREIVSNCFDSHTEAGVDAPVLVKRFRDPQDNTQYISFIDFGVGMSPDRVENIYGVYFESTKRVDNTQIGGFGIGGKTPLAYKRSTGQGEGEYDNSFNVITNFDGTKYAYLIYEGEDSPVITLLHSEPTTDRNGTEIRVPVLDSDIDKFTKEMVRQLYYFENIIFEGFEDDYRHGETLSNEYQIIRSKSFLFRGEEYSEYVHICLGRVAYPIDYSVLGLSQGDYRLPVAIRLEVGDINVTVSRESIDYSEATIKMLKKKLEVVKAEIASMLAKQYSDIVTLEQYFNVKNDFGRLVFSNGKSMYVGNLLKQSDIDFSNFAYSFMKMPNDRQLFRMFFNVKTYGKKPSRSRYSSKYEFEGGYKELQGQSNILYITGDFNRKIVKQAYLKDTMEMYHIVSNRNLCSSALLPEISELFNVHLDKTVDANGKPVDFIQSLIDMQEEYFAIVQAHAKDYDTLEIPEDYIEARKNKKVISPEMRNTTIPVRFVGSYGTDRIKLDALFNYNMPIFYGTKEDESKLRDAINIYGILFNENDIVYNYSSYDKQFNTGRRGYRSSKPDSKRSIMFLQLAQNNIKYMEYCKNAIHIDKFFVKMLYRKEAVVRQYFQTYAMIEKYNNLGDFYQDDFFSRIDAVWGAKIQNLNKMIEAIPEKAKDSTIGYDRHRLGRYFNLEGIEMTKEQKAILKEIEEIEFLKQANAETLRFINLRNDLETANAELITILQKVMAL
jgi:hypothetical protein